jgi:hypothetical protein
MERVSWVEHKGKRIILEDMSGLWEPTDIYAVSDTSTALICKQPEASVLLITNVTGTRYNPSVINRLKENTKLTNPYMKAYAVVGIGGLQRVVLQSVVQFTGQDIKICGSHEEAEEWLVRQ